MPNILTNQTATSVQAALQSNGFQLVSTGWSNGFGVYAYSNGQITYTVYASSEGQIPSLSLFNQTTGQIVVKYRLGGW